MLGDDGAVVTREDALLTQVSVDLRVVNSGDEAGHTALHQWRLPPLRRLARRVAVLAVLGGHNYFHWMFHLLPRIALLRDAGIAFDEIDLFATNPVRQPFQEQTLARLGIPRDRVIEIGPTTHVSADELVVPSRPSRMSEVAGWVRDFLRDTFLDPASKPADTPDRIYLTRSGSGHRRLVNEPQVRRLVQKHGFTPVTAETMSVADQARLFAGASVVVAPHGAGLANLVFCRPGVTVVEIFSPRYINGCYWQLSAWTGARYHYVIGTGQEPTGAAPIFDQYGDIAVDLDDLSRTLRLAGI